MRSTRQAGVDAPQRAAWPDFLVTAHHAYGQLSSDYVIAGLACEVAVPVRQIEAPHQSRRMPSLNYGMLAALFVAACFWALLGVLVAGVL